MSIPVISSVASKGRQSEGGTLISHGLPCLTTIDRSIHPARLTGNGVLDLDTRVDLDKVVTTHLVNEELGRTGVTVVDSLCELDSVVEDSLTDRLVEVGSRCDFDNLLVTTLNGTVALKEVDNVTLTIGDRKSVV